MQFLFSASVPFVISQWAVVVLVLIAANLIAIKFMPNLYDKARKVGCDPYDSSSYETETEIELDGVSISNAE